MEKWTNYATISIWSGQCTCFLFGVVLMEIYVSTYEYVIDSYQELLQHDGRQAIWSRWHLPTNTAHVSRD
jgi:hypothetical protein